MIAPRRPMNDNLFERLQKHKRSDTCNIVKGDLSPTSKEVPANRVRSFSVHIVGTGTYDGNILTYSLQGFETPGETPSFDMLSAGVIVICINRKSKMSPLGDYGQSARSKYEIFKAYNATSSSQKLSKVLVDSSMFFYGFF